MTRFRLAALCLAVASLPAAGAGDPPPLKLVDETKPGSRWVTVRADTPGKVVRFVPLDPGLDPFPLPLVDGKAFVAFAEKAGRYRVLAFTAVGDEPSLPATITVVVGTPDPPKDPPKDPADPPAQPTALYFLVVRPDGPAAPGFVKAMSDPAWDELRKKGHLVKDKTAAEAAPWFKADGAALPCVVTLRTTATSSTVARGPVPLPATAADILKLPEGVGQ